MTGSNQPICILMKKLKLKIFTNWTQKTKVKFGDRVIKLREDWHFLGRCFIIRESHPDLKECGLTTLETRRLRGDQIEVFKILNGHENIDPNIFFKINSGKITRGHGFTLVKGQNRLDFIMYSFSQRTVNEWNKLSADCVHSSSVNMFKNRIDNYLVRAGYT